MGKQMEQIKLIKSSFTLALTLSLLVGCGTKTNTTSSNSSQPENSTSEQLSSVNQNQISKSFTDFKKAFEDYETYIKELKVDQTEIENKDPSESIQDFERAYSKFQEFKTSYDKLEEKINTDSTLKKQYESSNQILNSTIDKVNNLLSNLDNLSKEYYKTKNDKIADIQALLNQSLEKTEAEDGLWGKTIIGNLIIYLNDASGKILRENIDKLSSLESSLGNSPPSTVSNETDSINQQNNQNNTNNNQAKTTQSKKSKGLFNTISNHWNNWLTIILLGFNGVLWYKYTQLNQENKKLEEKFKDFKRDTSAIIVAKIEHTNKNLSSSSTKQRTRTESQQNSSIKIESEQRAQESQQGINVEAESAKSNTVNKTQLDSQNQDNRDNSSRFNNPNPLIDVTLGRAEKPSNETQYEHDYLTNGNRNQGNDHKSDPRHSSSVGTFLKNTEMSTNPTNNDGEVLLFEDPSNSSAKYGSTEEENKTTLHKKDEEIKEQNNNIPIGVQSLIDAYLKDGYRGITEEDNVIEISQTDDSVQAEQNTGQFYIKFKTKPKNQGEYLVYCDKENEKLWLFPKRIKENNISIIEKLFNTNGKPSSDYNLKLKKPAEIESSRLQIFDNNEGYIKNENDIWAIEIVSNKGEIEWL